MSTPTVLIRFGADFSVLETSPELEQMVDRPARIVACKTDPDAAYCLIASAPNGKDEIREALEQNRWRRKAAARALGISRTTLWRKMRDAGLTDGVRPGPHEVE